MSAPYRAASRNSMSRLFAGSAGGVAFLVVILFGLLLLPAVAICTERLNEWPVLDSYANSMTTGVAVQFQDIDESDYWKEFIERRMDIMEKETNLIIRRQQEFGQWQWVVVLVAVCLLVAMVGVAFWKR